MHCKFPSEKIKPVSYSETSKALIVPVERNSLDDYTRHGTHSKKVWQNLDMQKGKDKTSINCFGELQHKPQTVALIVIYQQR